MTEQIRKSLAALCGAAVCLVLGFAIGASATIEADIIGGVFIAAGVVIAVVALILLAVELARSN